MGSSGTPSNKLPFDGDDSFFTYGEAGTAGASARAGSDSQPRSETVAAHHDLDDEEGGWGDESLPPRERVRIPAPARSFQAAAGIQGRQFAEQCDTLLGHLGFELRGRRVLTEVGVEIDQEAVSPNGRLVWFEYKGSVQGTRPGLRRTDTLKKAIANGALLRAVADPAPYLVITSHLPESGSGAAMLKAALRLRYFADVVCLYDPAATTRLNQW